MVRHGGFPDKALRKGAGRQLHRLQREQCPFHHDPAGRSGGIFNQTAIGWGRFAKGDHESCHHPRDAFSVDGILCDSRRPRRCPCPRKRGSTWSMWIAGGGISRPSRTRKYTETALGGPDTCTRLQTIAQVKFLRVISAEVMEKVEELRAAAKAVIKKIIARLVPTGRIR